MWIITIVLCDNVLLYEKCLSEWITFEIIPGCAGDRKSSWEISLEIGKDLATGELTDKRRSVLVVETERGCNVTQQVEQWSSGTSLIFAWSDQTGRGQWHETRGLLLPSHIEMSSYNYTDNVNTIYKRTLIIVIKPEYIKDKYLYRNLLIFYSLANCLQITQNWRRLT